MFEVTAIPALIDNYIWCWQLPCSGWVVVDPGAYTPVIKRLSGGDLKYILLTHHHNDHTGGVAELKAHFPDVKVCGPKAACRHIDHELVAGDEILGFKIIATPGHTKDHIIFVSKEQVFLGDHLFKYGCGRIFETDHNTMYQSLAKIKTLDPGLICYPAHEYTLKNLKFASIYKPWPNIEHELKAASSVSISLPMSLGPELEKNPFLNCLNLDEFIELRTLRDNF